MILGTYIILSYIAVITVLYTECRPFSQYFVWESDDGTLRLGLLSETYLSNIE
jgi:hypothetical protein